MQIPDIKNRRRKRLDRGLRNRKSSYRRLIGIWNPVARKAAIKAWSGITFECLLTARLIMHRLCSRPGSPRYSKHIQVIGVGSPRKSEESGVQVLQLLEQESFKVHAKLRLLTHGNEQPSIDTEPVFLSPNIDSHLTPGRHSVHPVNPA